MIKAKTNLSFNFSLPKALHVNKPVLLLSILLLILASLFQNCAPSRYVKPLAKKQSAALFSFGGELIKYSNTPIPIPFTTMGYAYGLTDRITVYANLNSTSALFSNLQTDIGATILLYEKTNKFGFTVSPALQSAFNLRNKTGFRVWPSIDLNYFLHFKNKPSYLYVGLNSWIEFSKYRAHHEVQEHHLIPNFQLGYTRVRTKWQHQFEIKYLAIGVPNLPGVVEYIGINGKGTLGIFYSLIRKF
jgi:hypothetical protein